MSCGCGKDFDSGNCVIDVLKEIVRAQRDVVDHSCSTSCERSIDDLLGETDTRNGLDTVPVILYCKDGCKPFKGFGADRKMEDKIGPIVSSFIFRVKKIDDYGCATLELLLAHEQPCGYNDLKDPTDQKTKNLKATGICITADLHCFCHVTCLPAISAFD
jgi:spore coat protein Z